MTVSASSQQRLVHRQEFELPQLEETVAEMSVDGGKVRLRTAVGDPCIWRDYKAVNLHGASVGAFFEDNEGLVNWVNQQPLATPLICLGDGHDGIWNLFADIGDTTQRQEVLDWYHLTENLGKVGGSQQRLDAVEACLWRGDVEGSLAQFEDWSHPRVTKFVAYVQKHRHRIVNYSYYQCEGISIGSGAIESTVKQIGRRLKISGAQWERQNVPQVLKQRCAYLNGDFYA
ncbi:serine/threonine protein kinase [Geitlerinema sp. FC II]|nr:serine/threonine protein kinase [Geitlerinema sp. FC II]